MEILLGVLASGLVQLLKRYMPNQWFTLGLLGLISIALAAGYTLVVDTGYWPLVGSVLVSAGAFYAFFFQRFENPSTS